MDIILVYTEGVLKPSKNGKGRRQEGFIKKQFSKNSWNIGKMQNRYRAWWAKGKTGILYAGVLCPNPAKSAMLSGFIQ